MKKQLKTWKADFDKYWDKTSLVVRIMIGAVISLLITYVVINKINRPLSKKVLKAQKAISDTTVVDGSLFILEELRQKRIKFKKRLETWTKKLEDSKDCESCLTPLESSKVVIAIRELFYKNGLKLLNEQRIKKQVKLKKQLSSYKKRHKTTKVNSRIKLNPPEYIDHISYQISAYGQFGNIKKFFYDINQISHVFIMNNIKFGQYEGTVLNNRFQVQHGIKLDFELHIPYLKNVTISSNKDGKK